MSHPMDDTARLIFVTAIREDRCGELLEALFEGGSATVDMGGQLVIVSTEGLDALMRGGEA